MTVPLRIASDFAARLSHVTRALSIAVLAVLALAGCGGDADVRSLASEREGFELERCIQIGFAVVVGEREAVHRCTIEKDGTNWYRCYAVIDGRAYPVAEQARGLGC